VIARFNTAEYRTCVEPLEALYFADRNTFYQGLLHLVVALLQLQRGMVRGPRIRLSSAAELLTPYAPWHRGLDVEGLLGLIEKSLDRLPDGIVEMATQEMEALELPVFRLELSVRRVEAETAGESGR
jgi:hypothetical protein